MTIELYAEPDACGVRYRRSRPKGDATRAKILEHIIKNPGSHFSLLKRELKVENGSLQYNLERLVREDKLKRITTKNRTYYFPNGGLSVIITDTRDSVLDAIKTNPGISQKEIANLLGIKPASVSYHIENLMSEGALSKIKCSGRTNYAALQPVHAI